MRERRRAAGLPRARRAPSHHPRGGPQEGRRPDEAQGHALHAARRPRQLRRGLRPQQLRRPAGRAARLLRRLRLRRPWRRPQFAAHLLRRRPRTRKAVTDGQGRPGPGRLRARRCARPPSSTRPARTTRARCCRTSAPSTSPGTSTCCARRSARSNSPYYGRSFGSYIGTVYAAMFPKRVRALALDGAYDPEHYANQPVRLRPAAVPGAGRRDEPLPRLVRRRPGRPAGSATATRARRSRS